MVVVVQARESSEETEVQQEVVEAVVETVVEALEEVEKIKQRFSVTRFGNFNYF